MNGHDTALTFDELSTARAAIRVIRYLGVILMAVALPVLVALATPLLGGALLSAILLSPLLLGYALVAAAQQAEAERRRARA